jgi:hypothetical protein
MRRSKDELVHFFCGANFWKILVLRCYMNSVQNLAAHMQEGSERSKIKPSKLKIMPNHAPAASPPPLARVIQATAKKKFRNPAPLVTVNIAPECLHSTSSPTLRLPSPPASISPV